jgi:hypothetical protein
MRLPGERHARANRPAAVPREQRLDLGRRDLVAALAVLEDAKLVLDVLGPVD